MLGPMFLIIEGAVTIIRAQNVIVKLFNHLAYLARTSALLSIIERLCEGNRRLTDLLANIK